MGEHAEWLRQPPGGEGVGGVALVVDGEAADEPLVQQVRVEIGQVLGQEHALVDHRPAGHRADVQLVDLGGDGLLLDAAADDVQVALERGFVGGGAVAHDDLLDLRARGVGLLTNAAHVDRHLAPAMDGVAEIQDLGLDDLAAALLGGEVGLGQEHLAHGDALDRPGVAAALDVFGEEILRDLDMDAGAVPGLAVGIHGAAVPHRLQRVDASLHHVAPGATVQ